MVGEGEREREREARWVRRALCVWGREMRSIVKFV